MKPTQQIRRLANEHESIEDKIIDWEIESEEWIERQYQIMEEIRELTENILNCKW